MIVIKIKKMIKFIGVFLVLIGAGIILYIIVPRHTEINAFDVKSMKMQILLLDKNNSAWRWHEKEITRKEDIKKVISFINSIPLRIMKQKADFGFSPVVIIKGKKDYILVFKGDAININGTNYKMSLEQDKKVENIYEELNYKQTNVVKLFK